MTVNVTAFLHAGIYGKKFFLLLKFTQKETVIENGSVFADNVNIGSIRCESGQRTGKDSFCSVGKTYLSRLNWRIIVPITDLHTVTAVICVPSR